MPPSYIYNSLLEVRGTAHSQRLHSTQYSTKIRLHANILPHRGREEAEGDAEEMSTMNSWKKKQPLIEH